jgi:hypothetical protein
MFQGAHGGWGRDHQEVDEEDLRVRNTTYGLFVELARAPTVHDVAERDGLATRTVEEAWRRLHDAHALVLQDREIRMANPFSAVPTAHRVQAANRWWYANCAWDAFGICAALHVDGEVNTSCPDCSEQISVAVRDGQPDDTTLRFHCLVPAVAWWDDIVFT